MHRIEHSRHRHATHILLAALLAVTGWIRASENPFVGNWALTLPNGEAGWLGIVETKALPRIGGGSVGLLAELKNQAGEVCMRGRLTVLVMSRPAST